MKGLVKKNVTKSATHQTAVPSKIDLWTEEANFPPFFYE
jgi:hypothetical protein